MSAPEPKLLSSNPRWVDTQTPDFLVPDLLPAASLACITATPGAGKTTLACMLAAAVPPPIDPAAPTILFIAPLADIAVQLRPRFNQLHLNPARVRVYEHAYLFDAPYPRRPITIADLDALRTEIANPARHYRLLIIDNAELFFDLPGRPTRSTLLKHLYRLHDIAHNRNISILILLTIPRYNANPLATTLLSCIEEVSRSSWILAPDKENPQQRLLFHHKTTIPAEFANTQYAGIPATRKVATLPADVYTDPWGEPCPYPNEPHQYPSPTPVADPQSPIPLSEDVASVRALSLLPPDPDAPIYRDYLTYRPPPRPRGPVPAKLQFACEVLTDILADGPVRSLDVLNQMAAAGIKQPTALEAKSRLNIQSHRINNLWHWFPVALVNDNPDPDPQALAVTTIENRKSKIENAAAPNACAHPKETTSSSTKPAESDPDPLRATPCDSVVNPLQIQNQESKMAPRPQLPTPCDMPTPTVTLQPQQ